MAATRVVNTGIPEYKNGSTGQLRWHPKISPYRLSVISTTIGFGSAKIVESQTGNSLIPTTIEWVAGTLFFLIMFSVSSYDSREDVPRYMSWLFEPDCMNILWRILSTMSIERPQYTTVERMTQTGSPHVGVTTFRLLMSSTVLMFGMTKATLGYFGQSTAMNWTEWTFAVPITVFFYILGLYEYNSGDIWPSFYFTDRKDPFFDGIFQGSIITLYVSLAGLALYGYMYSIWHLFNGSSETIFGPIWIPLGPTDSAARRLINLAFQRSLQLIMLGVLMIIAISLIASLFVISAPAQNVGIFVITHFRKIVRRARQIAFRIVGPSVFSIPAYLSQRGGPYLPEFPRVRPQVLRHAFLHLFGLACCMIPTGLIAGLVMITFDVIYLMLSTPTLIGIGVGIMIGLCALFLIAFDVLLIGYVLYSLVSGWNG